MLFYDPQKFLVDLREHLARHDRPLAFLFGAGTSAAVNVAPAPKKGEKPKHKALVPAVLELTDLCQSAVTKLGIAFEKAWKSITQECKLRQQQGNVEDILSRIRAKFDAVGDKELLSGLTSNDLEKLDITIRDTILLAATPPIPDELPHLKFARWVRDARRTIPLEIFTANYDVLFEYAFESTLVPLFDGFVGANEPFFSSELVEQDHLLPGAAWLRFWKIHGSVNWVVKERKEGIRRVLRISGSKSGNMILPSHLKYDESRKQPYLTLIARLGRVLERDGALLVTNGYSFSDQHINAVILTVLDNRNRSSVISLQYGCLDELAPLVALAVQTPNLTVAARDGAIIGGKRYQWRIRGGPMLDLENYLDVVFDADAKEPGGDGPDFVTGSMRLGDFVRFCKFLDAMIPVERASRE
jgi:hypothetical protein